MSQWDSSPDALLSCEKCCGYTTEITKGSMSFTYEYDEANQLIRENLY